jgi:chemotaxis protein MotB
MRRATFIASFGLIGLAGCVPQATYDDLMSAYQSQEQQLLQAQSDLETSRANEAALRQQLAKAIEDFRIMGGDRDAINAALDKLLADYDALLKRGDSLGPLPSDMAEALESLAAQFPELLSFDRARGMLRFNTDFTFDSGSAELKSQARQLIPTLASIMNSATAAGLEAHVVGHTDNVPVTQPNTVKQHKNNVYLSTHRAISVRDALVNSGVSAGRFMVAGFGEYRPVVENPSRGGAAENRRVEIFFRPMPPDGVLSAAGGAAAPEKGSSAPARPAAAEEPLK